MVGCTGDGSGPTKAPDLMSVGNFRRGPFTVEYEPTTCVDFVFDQPIPRSMEERDQTFNLYL